jgi:hypothetical protein
MGKGVKDREKWREKGMGVERGRGLERSGL